MNKWKDLKEAMRNPPEERLCLINANGYKIGILAILTISVVIFQTVVWYISFIFLVQLVSNWVGYKREMKQYNSIINARKQMGVYKKIEDDPSFTRRRFRLITEELGNSAKYIVSFIVAVPTVLFLDIASRVWYVKLLILFLIAIGILITMLFPVYWMAQIKSGITNGKNRNK